MALTKDMTTVDVRKTDKSRLNRVRGEKDLKSYNQVITFLLDDYFESR